ncbi:MAG: diguanylate cyclase [Herminiimonas sp.]|nr:diguanylate cyclase [Herminiimonas sp.]
MISSDEILKAKILVVDDCVDNVELLLAILEQSGYDGATSTTNPAEVCELHRVNQYDLILLDLEMPGVDGFEVMEGLKEVEKYAYIPVLAITGQPNFKIIALEAGAKDFITKPFDIVEVQKRIHNMLEVRLLFKALASYGKAQEKLALHDALTGLPNRRLFEDRLAIAMEHSRRIHRTTAVLYLDLDGFKEVNDTFGHEYGDKLLVSVASRLKIAARAEDTVARIGGDEFMIVLAELATVADVHGPASNFVRVISEPYFIDGQNLNVTVSIGISFFPNDADTVEALVGRADKALYEAKSAGRNRYRLTAL